MKMLFTERRRSILLWIFVFVPENSANGETTYRHKRRKSVGQSHWWTASLGSSSVQTVGHRASQNYCAAAVDQTRAAGRGNASVAVRQCDGHQSPAFRGARTCLAADRNHAAHRSGNPRGRGDVDRVGTSFQTVVVAAEAHKVTRDLCWRENSPAKK